MWPTIAVGPRVVWWVRLNATPGGRGRQWKSPGRTPSLRRLDELKLSRKPDDGRQRRINENRLYHDDDHRQKDVDEETRDPAFHALNHAVDPREGVEERSCRQPDREYHEEPRPQSLYHRRPAIRALERLPRFLEQELDERERPLTAMGAQKSLPAGQGLQPVELLRPLRHRPEYTPPPCAQGWEGNGKGQRGGVTLRWPSGETDRSEPTVIQWKG